MFNPDPDPTTFFNRIRNRTPALDQERGKVARSEQLPGLETKRPPPQMTMMTMMLAANVNFKLSRRSEILTGPGV